MSGLDYGKYYDLEQYVFGQVSTCFAETGKLSSFDFFCIVIWKANRAKSKVAKRLLAKGYSDLDEAVSALAKHIVETQSPRERMRVMFSRWGFLLPMASAILTVLYPDDFTVYDVRVCDVIGRYRNTRDRTNFDNVWSDYEGYMEAVKGSVAGSLSLRDKDRWLWGKSFYEQLQRDLRRNFEKEQGAEA